MNLTKEQLEIVRNALLSYIAYGDWQDNEHADIVAILNIVGEERCK